MERINLHDWFQPHKWIEQPVHWKAQVLAVCVIVTCIGTLIASLAILSSFN